MGSWSRILSEPREGPFRIPAYSEFMPPPYVGVKPYGEPDPFTRAGEDGWNVTEFEEIQELRPGLERIAGHVFEQLDRLAAGRPTQFSKTILDGNPAMPPRLRPPETVILSLALSRTQDDKGRVRWTLFGSSHLGPAAAFWRSVGSPEDLRRVLGDIAMLDEENPGFAPRWVPGSPRLLTFRFFADLPAAAQAAYLEGRTEIVPAPTSLLFWGHGGYRRLAEELPHAMQIPLLHLFPRTQSRYGLRIPQSGWLDEFDDGRHRTVNRIVRTHRWQRVGRDDDPQPGVMLDDPVTVALFSSDPDQIALYGKPMARNAQIWTEDYRLLLDGPRATRPEIDAAVDRFRRGRRFGYRFFYPPMKAGTRAVFWNRPVVARRGDADVSLCGFLAAERDAEPPIDLKPVFLGRLAELTADARKIVEWHELLGPLAPSLARALLDLPKDRKLEAWLEKAPAELRSRIGGEPEPTRPLTYPRTATREFEEKYWALIARLSGVEFREKNNADAIAVNEGRTGGTRGRPVDPSRHLDTLGEHLRRHYANFVVEEHAFRWETEFDYPWSHGWRRNQTGEVRERNLIVKIPGRNRGEAILMCDHYDTAYMEDLYYPSKGGDRLRAAAAGADDNHSATAALMLAAEILSTLDLARDVWLVHLTGEEFPADCLGARALARDAVEGRLPARIRGAYVLDMIAHNHDRDRDVFQIAPGEGRGSARLAEIAHHATMRWNAGRRTWNAAPGRSGRSRRGTELPPIAAHPHLHGEIRPEWHPRSSLYNTDGQIFSDVGIPVVLFMENYDINRTGYHDTEDTIANIDLDYGAAVAAIAIESVAAAATVSL